MNDKQACTAEQRRAGQTPAEQPNH